MTRSKNSSSFTSFFPRMKIADDIFSLIKKGNFQAALLLLKKVVSNPDQQMKDIAGFIEMQRKK